MTRAIFSLVFAATLAACGASSFGDDDLPEGVVMSEDATPEERAALLAAVAELEGETGQAAPATGPRRGLFAFLRPEPDAPSSTPDGPPGAQLPDETLYESEPQKSNSGFLAFLRGGAPNDAIANDQTVAEAPEEVGVESDLAQDPPASARPQGGLRGFFAARAPTRAPTNAAAGALSEPAAPGQTLQFGEVAEVCDLPRREMGTEVDTYPSDGRTMYRLYDTDPSSTGLRTQYIVGLKRGCALQVTASLVLFGSPAAHEIHRFGAAMKDVPYSDTDKAYEQIKARICNVGHGQPCKGSGVDRMGRKVAFVSVYRQFGQPTGWLELMLADGRLVSKNMR